MTVAELISRLENEDPEARVLVATQPSHPLALQIDGVVTLSAQDERDEDDEPADADDTETVWIAAGSHPSDRGYAPRGVFSS
jgi:hypothetical protein